ncbi:SDR family oxidoreductase [Ideonella azotifigens]|uniref:SDR family NAD(P)-dependent oxidoreductase n=2 Tax=Ideonella azotifigens TaxID=513160 RepID=A0ABP3VBZ6_9BURK|nr:SDR family oxidoreductase [Ideonella azotifigens]MCD2344466.1 SDR family oxidoreductase [Ideonella azotifigens]
MPDRAPSPLHLLNGQVAFVTGATKGLGAELALALARQGAHVAIVGRDKAAGDEVAAAVRKVGSDALVLQADVTNGAALEAAALRTRDHFGRVDRLLCCAGVGSPRQPVWQSSEEDYRACFDINVLGVMLSLRAVMPLLIERGEGRVVVIGGTYGHKGVANAALYAASKWAVRGLVKSAALEGGPHNVTANIVAPGGIAGPRLKRLFEASAEREGLPYDTVLRRFTAQSALGRLVSGEDVAQAVIHLFSDGGRLITGQDLVVDAGTLV